MGFWGLQFLHPFDFRRPRRAFELLRERLGADFDGLVCQPDEPLSDAELELVHQPDYLASLRRSLDVARVLEIPLLALLPRFILNRIVLGPMRIACAGTLLAGREALAHGLAFNLSGGYHHAKPAQGEGFCIFNDIGYCVLKLRAEGLLTGPVLYIDLDAHQGNGVCYVFRDDPEVHIFDVYNGKTYPVGDEQASQRIDADFPLAPGSQDELYLETLKEQLGPFLDRVPQAGLVIYNAGTDIYEHDMLGGLGVSRAGVLERDLFVVRSVRERGWPLLVLPSGGYSQVSYQMIVDCICHSRTGTT